MISVDTNILVYAANPSAARHEKALSFMSGYSDQELVLNGVTSIMILPYPPNYGIGRRRPSKGLDKRLTQELHSPCSIMGWMSLPLPT
jgi:hypothetical protein